MATKSIQNSLTKTTKKTAKEAFTRAKVSKKVSTKKAGSNKFQKKTSSDSVKEGKVVVLERNDSDEDSLDLDNMEETREAMAEIQK